MDLIGDKLNHEISIVSFGVPEHYEWSLIDVLNEALKLVLDCFDRLSQEDTNSRLAIKKLKTQMFSAASATKTAIYTVKAAGSSGEAVEGLKE